MSGRKVVEKVWDRKKIGEREGRDRRGEHGVSQGFGGGEELLV